MRLIVQGSQAHCSLNAVVAKYLINKENIDD